MNQSKKIISAIKSVSKEKVKKGQMNPNAKPYSECYSVEDFLDYYEGASKAELRARLKSLGGKDKHLSGSRKNERDAVCAWLS